MSLVSVTRTRAAALLLAAASIVALRCSASAQTLDVVRLATISIAGASQPAIAKDRGFFTKAGLDVDVRMMQGSSAIATAVLTNAIDIGFAAADTSATLRQKGVTLVAIAPTSEYVSALDSRNAALVVQPNSPLRQAKDLNGKVIGVNSLAGVAFLSTRAWIDQNGGDSSSVKFVEIPFSTMPVALETGRVDAVQVAEPYIEPTKRNGRILTYGLNDAVAKHFIISVWFTTPEWAAAHPDIVRRFAAAIRETANWANQKSNKAKLDEILVKFTKLEPGVIADMLHPHFADSLTAALLQPPIDLNAKYAKIAPLPAQELIYVPPR